QPDIRPQSRAVPQPQGAGTGGGGEQEGRAGGQARAGQPGLQREAVVGHRGGPSGGARPLQGPSQKPDGGGHRERKKDPQGGQGDQGGHFFSDLPQGSHTPQDPFG